MNSDNKTDFQKYVEEREKERALQKEQTFEDYINWNKEYKQDYWDKYIFNLWWRHEYWDFPISIQDFKNKFNDLENNFNKFILWIIESLEDEWFTWDINDIFILDKETEEYLRWIWYIQKQDIKKKIIEIIENKKDQEILWENISFNDLIERIWDLYYDSLSSFLSSLVNYIYDKKVSELLKKTSENISNAYSICEKPTLEFLEKVKESNEDIEFKHTSEVKWIKINNDELAKIVWNLVSYKLSDFLEKLSAKIQRDWETDKWKWRVKLANELFACANKLKEASDLLK